MTSEHIISDSASTSSCSSPFSSTGVMDLRCSSLTGLGDVNELCGVDMVPSGPEGAWEGDVGVDVVTMDACRDLDCFSVSFFSRAPRSIVSSSPSSTPDSLRRCSIRPNRFSSPSIYLALSSISNSMSGLLHGGDAYPLGGFLFFSTCVKTQSVL